MRATLGCTGFDAGICKIVDLVVTDANKTKRLMRYEELQHQMDRTIHFIEYRGVMEAIPKAWREMLKVSDESYREIRKVS